MAAISFAFRSRGLGVAVPAACRFFLCLPCVNQKGAGSIPVRGAKCFIDLQTIIPSREVLFCNTVGTFVGMLLQYPSQPRSTPWQTRNPTFAVFRCKSSLDRIVRSPDGSYQGGCESPEDRTPLTRLTPFDG